MSGIAALKGYRTQFLYSLYFVLSEEDFTKVYRLEGDEDIDLIGTSGSTEKVIQIKNLNAPITLSDLISNKRTSFFKRFLTNKLSNPNLVPVLVSFGAISDSLEAWLSSKSSISASEKKELKRYSLTDEEWLSIKHALEIIEVAEDDLQSSIEDKLKQEYPFIDPKPTVSILLYWLSVCAEKRMLVTKKELSDVIDSVGLYLSERIAVHEQLGLYIKPLSDSQSNSADSSILADEYYSGISARYEHIYHDLDVNRDNYNRLIKESFEKHRVVIIQGASGQGKSTLAYRFVYDYCPEHLVYEVLLQEEVINTRKAILAITSLAKGLRTPILLLIHVSPNSVGWMKLVREFSFDKNIQFLITIRQEDWYKATSTGIDFLHKEIELSLSKSEAEEIYLKLDSKVEDLDNNDFEEAWIKFGENGPLLEFVFSVTKGDTLKNRLKQQVAQLEKEIINSNSLVLDVLKIVALADFYGAKIDTKKLRHISNIQPIIKRLEKEYLIKSHEDGAYISGLHPLRSLLIVNELFDETINDKQDYVLLSLRYIDDHDLYMYLVHVFNHNIISHNQLINKVQDIECSWVSYAACLNALLWKGVCDYIEENRSVLAEAYDTWGDAWIMFTDIYFGKTFSVETLFEAVDLFSDEDKAQALKINEQLSNKENSFEYARLFFERISLPAVLQPVNDELKGFGFVCFWLSQLQNTQLNINNYLQELSNHDFDASTISALLLGVKQLQKDITKPIAHLEEKFLEALQLEYNIPHIEVFEQDIKAQYIVNIFASDEEEFSLNDKSVSIIDLLRSAFPNKQKYSAIGIGHNIPLLQLPHDNSSKNIDISNLPLGHWTRLNALARMRFEYVYLPNNWSSFHQLLSNWEKEHSEKVNLFNTTFKKYRVEHELSTLLPLVENANYVSLKSIKKPKSISDPLGVYINIDSEKRVQAGDEKEKTSIKKFDTKFSRYFKELTEYKSSLENFFRQSGEVIYHRLKKITDPNYEHDSNFEYLSQINLYSAIKNTKRFRHTEMLYSHKFDHLYDTKVQPASLYSTALYWREYITEANNIGNSYHRADYLSKIKTDFESRIKRGFKKYQKYTSYSLSYKNKIGNLSIPVVIIQVSNPAYIPQALETSFTVIHDAIANLDYSSLKQLMIDEYFEHIYLLPLINKNTINNSWYQIPNYNFRKAIEELANFNWVPTQIPNKIYETLKLNDWNKILPKVQKAQTFLGKYYSLPIMVQHIVQVSVFDTLELNETGEKVFSDQVQIVHKELQENFQFVLDFLFEVLNEFSFDETKCAEDALEYEFWEAMTNIRDNLFPTEKGDEVDYQVRLELSDFVTWNGRLSDCSEDVYVFYNLLVGKYIDQYVSR